MLYGNFLKYFICLRLRSDFDFFKYISYAYFSSRYKGGTYSHKINLLYISSIYLKYKFTIHN
jgi:hypothetical protein